MSILSFFRKSAPAPHLPKDDDAMIRLYKKLRRQSFIAGTVGYSLYYVCRTSLNVVKKPILESGALDATQLGVIGSALLFAYAIGKFVNGFLSDHSNIKRFMAAGLAVSAVANLLVGLLGFANGGGIVGNMVLFVAFAVMWGVNGWSQSMGAPPAIIALSRWYPLSKRGTYYGFFSASHNLGEFLSFLFVGAVVGFFGWQWGFVGSSVAGVLGVLTIVLLMHDTPESKGLPPIEELTGEETPGTPRDHGKTSDLQRSVIRWRSPARSCISAAMRSTAGACFSCRRSKAIRWPRPRRSFRSMRSAASWARSFRAGSPTPSSTGGATCWPSASAC